MSTMTLNWYEIKVKPSKKQQTKSKSDLFFKGDNQPFNGYGRYGYEAGWRCQKIFIPLTQKVKTIFRQAKNQEHAMKMGKRIGQVLDCHKVDASFHFQKIEALDLHQKPLTVSIQPEDEYFLNINGELTPTQKATREELEKKYQLPLDLS